jgi:hypothetical protein
LLPQQAHASEHVQEIANPLYSYKFHKNPVNRKDVELSAPTAQGLPTLRHPIPNDPNDPNDDALEASKYCSNVGEFQDAIRVEVCDC